MQSNIDLVEYESVTRIYNHHSLQNLKSLGSNRVQDNNIGIQQSDTCRSTITIVFNRFYIRSQPQRWKRVLLFFLFGNVLPISRISFSGWVK